MDKSNIHHHTATAPQPQSAYKTKAHIINLQLEQLVEIGEGFVMHSDNLIGRKYPAALMVCRVRDASYCVRVAVLAYAIKECVNMFEILSEGQRR